MKIPTFFEVIVPLIDGFSFYAGDAITWFFLSIAYPIVTWVVVVAAVWLMWDILFVRSTSPEELQRIIAEQHRAAAFEQIRQNDENDALSDEETERAIDRMRKENRKAFFKSDEQIEAERHAALGGALIRWRQGDDL